MTAPSVAQEAVTVTELVKLPLAGERTGVAAMKADGATTAEAVPFIPALEAVTVKGPPTVVALKTAPDMDPPPLTLHAKVGWGESTAPN